MIATVSEEDRLGDEEDVGFRRRRPASVDEEIDITPMIDLVFLLLIFFLVSSVPDHATAIDLPEATHGTAVSQKDAVIFTIAAGGYEDAPVYAADGRIAGTELPNDAEMRRAEVRRLVEAGIRENQVDVVIKADRNVAHREVAALIKAVSQVDGVQIHLAVADTK